MKKLLILILPLFLLAPTAHAANLPLLNPNFTIVPSQCSACPCGFAGTLQLVQNLVNVAVSVAFLIMVIIIIYAGALFMFSAVSPEQRSKAKSMMLSAVVGIVIVMCGWLIVDFVMKSLYNPETDVGDGTKFGPWNEIIGGGGEWCIVGQTTKPLYGGGDLGTGSGLETEPVSSYQGTAGCPTCTSLKDLGLSCKNAASCTLDAAVASKVKALNDNWKGGFIVTEAYPPTVQHSNKCHANGTCIDADNIGGGHTPANIQAFANAASKQGLWIVFETKDCRLSAEVRERGVRAYCNKDKGYEHITGEHFSVYSN